jgi:uncharacterized protein DUF6876
MIEQHVLDQFNNGTENWYRHWTRSLIYTDGVAYIAENGGGWLVDAIASYQGTKALKTDMLKDFQIWILKVDREAKKGVLTCIADDGWPPAITQEIEYTDFPLDEIKLYVERGEEMTLMLPSER